MGHDALAEGTRRLVQLTAALRLVLVAFLLVGAVQTMAVVVQIVVLSSHTIAPWVLALQPLFRVIGWFGIASLACFLLSALLMPAWVWRAHSNLEAAELSGLHYQPGWAAVCYLLPFVNFVVPARAMRELYNRSHGEDEWNAEVEVGAVNSWWACFVAGNLIQAALIIIGLNNRFNPVKLTAPPLANLGLIAFSNLLLIGAATCLFGIAGRISRAQPGMAGIAEVFA